MHVFTGVWNTNNHSLEIEWSKNTSGQTSAKPLSNPIKENALLWLKKTMEIKAAVSPEGIVVDGYYLGTFEFDSLTGHPGIRY